MVKFYQGKIMSAEIILVSDNHSAEKPLDIVLRRHRRADYFIHCGDSQMPKYMLRSFICVRGNNDFEPGFDREFILSVEEHRILILHGHLENTWRSNDILVYKAQKNRCDIVCFGHTHMYLDTIEEGIRLLNPGSLRHNRDGSRPGYMQIFLDPEKILVNRMEL